MSSSYHTRVTKKLNPGDPGTRRLAERYGNELICIRYRETSDGQQKLTTIELVIDIRSTQAAHRRPRRHLRNDDIVHLRIDPQDKDMRLRLLGFGATWNPRTQTWTTQWLIAKHLKLTQYRVQK